MLPQAYGLPTAILLIVSGALACFAGYRLFRIVLGIYGFIFGAMLASSMMGVTSSLGMVLAALVGGIIGSVVLVMAYFVGIALTGAGLGALLGHIVWSWFQTGDPPVIVVVVVSLVGAIAAMILQRYVIIVATAFGGAATLMIGVWNALGTRGLTQGSNATEVFILYPTSLPGGAYAQLVWLGLSVLGIAVQLGLTGKKK